ncbi:MAG: hypothetical protein DHS80DRAFT_31290 [Piptocephalis tieghemiana]|nr:MAG: hypothetical protein DHS80DRAFT_31290 [Piptocephalis tieghemiana]
MTPARSPTLLKAIGQTWRRLPLPWRRAHFIGLDVQGNEYYEQKQPTFPGRPVRRWMQPAMTTMDLFEETHIPVQWQSWLRHRRPEPPTDQEIQADEAYRLRTVARAAKLEEQWQKERMGLEEKRTATAASRVNAPEPTKVPLPSSQKEDQPMEKSKPVKKRGVAPSVHYPTGQGETFTPGSWTPSLSSSSQVKEDKDKKEK